MSDRPEYSVWLFFPNGDYDPVKRFIGAEEAVDTAKDYTLRPAAVAGLIQRIIITDGGDCIAFEWIHGRGVTYPTPEERAAAKAETGQ